MAPTNRQLLILLVLALFVLSFIFLINYTISAVRELSVASLNMAGVETDVSFNTVPVRITGLDYNIENGRVILSWNPIMKSKLNGYRIYRGSSPDNRFIIGGANQTNFVDKDIKRGEVYYYGVTAINDLGEGRVSAPLRVEIR